MLSALRLYTRRAGSLRGAGPSHYQSVEKGRQHRSRIVHTLDRWKYVPGLRLLRPCRRPFRTPWL